MKDFLSKPSNFSKVEFWAATTIFVFVVFFHVSYGLSTSWSNSITTTDGAVLTYSYYFVSNLLEYIVCYAAFLLLNFVLAPRLIRRENLLLNIPFLVLVFVLLALFDGWKDTQLRTLMNPSAVQTIGEQNAIFQQSFLYAAWLLMVFGFYTVIRYTSLFLLSNAETIQERYPAVSQVGLVGFIIWMIVLFFLIVTNIEPVLYAGWAVVVPCSLLLYLFSFQRLLPKAMGSRKPFRFYAGRILLIVILSLFPVWALSALISTSADRGAVIMLFNAFVQAFLVAPFAWILYKRQLRDNEQLYSLQQKLGQSNANFDFLRSQINPHFLFNALNTIYGTALQEGAERTSEGIEKLGDMMRFMLQENMQDKIALSREIDYLNNYISLQRLRTDSTPTVKIEAAIEPQVFPFQIAPMLLIPFVENAFKHGISLREPSQIKITLEIKERTLYFDVFNSKHLRADNDPEKDKSGIGLTNVRQRLKMQYPGRHELTVRETSKDFFVHLTLQLAK